MAKNIVYDQNNNVLKAWLSNKGVEQNDLAKTIASEMCSRFGLQILNVVKIQDVWGSNAISRPLTKDDEVGTHNIGYVLGFEGLPVGWATAKKSEQYGAFQYEYHHLINCRAMEQRYTQSVKLTSILNKVKSKFLGEFQGSYAEGVPSFRSHNITSHDMDSIISSVSNPENIIKQKRAIDMPIEMREAIVNSLIGGVPIKDKSMLEQVTDIHSKYNALSIQLNESNKNHNKLHEKPIYLLGYSKVLPNIYTLVKAIQPPKSKEVHSPKPIILDYEIFTGGLENSKYKDILTPIVTMWMIAKDDVLKDKEHSPIKGSLYHDVIKHGYHSSSAIYDDALDIVCYSKRDEHDNDITLTDIIAFLDVD